MVFFKLDLRLDPKFDPRKNFDLDFQVKNINLSGTFGFEKFILYNK